VTSPPNEPVETPSDPDEDPVESGPDPDREVADVESGDVAENPTNPDEDPGVDPGQEDPEH
jgi:hypothetical protein